MGFNLCVHVSNALISIYAKCGSIEEAQSDLRALLARTWFLGIP
jgi:hypothetical protein